ncbi:MAG: hypothetical protein RLY49_72 [Candidatus Parcubacteria bacterium]|jgi:DNA-directed RNA polymerase subunit RPC12/RpoP
MTEKYLKSHQYYSDLYDRFTVERCREIEKSLNEKDSESSNESDAKEKAMMKFVKDMELYVTKGERYLKKSETIRDWTDRDKKRDDLIENSEPPEDIRCLSCRNKVVVTFKELWTELDKEDRILFMFDCPNKCLPRRAFFSNGEEWRLKPNPCLHCDGVLKIKDEKKEGDKIISIYKCSQCDYEKKDEFELSAKKDEEVDDKFAEDRDRFCLTDEEGQEYREEKWRWEQMAKFAEDWKKEDERRIEKLKTNPKGFHLDGRGYTCFICGQHTGDGDNWYDQYGIKCLVCQKAIDEGEIPPTLASDKESWYTKYDLESYFNLKGPTLKSWIKKGIIKSRNISHYGKGSWYELFMIEDNKDFLPPKELLESKRGRIEEDGKIEERYFPWYCFVNPHEHLKGYKIMNHLRVLSPEEVRERKDIQKQKDAERDAKREARRQKRFKK